MQKPLIVITGASSGIGEATARAFSAAGHPLLLLARRSEPTEALGLPDTLSIATDVTDRKQVAKAISTAEAKFGPVDGMVNNAGIMLLGEFANQDPAEWEKMFAVNVNGLLNGIHAVVPGMIERKGGTIINLSSIAGIKSFPKHVAYVGTKFAVSGLSENLREELAPHGVRVVTIEPGAVETPLISHTTDAAIKEDYASWKTEMGGVLKPEDIANAIVYAYQQPKYVCIREIVIAATGQAA
jgi:NADP-dependent 3-hydroxy acid dehydrogenase YdfG